MNFLLDTHVFLWYITGDSRIREELLAQLQDARNLVWLSVISEWEIIIKYQRDPFDRMLICQALRHNLMLVTADRTMTDYANTVSSLAIRFLG